MDRKNRDFDLLDAREELMLVGLLKEASFGEAKCEDLRQALCELEEFEPYSVYKALQHGSSLSFLSAIDVSCWLKKQNFKTTLLCAEDIKNVFEQVADGHKDMNNNVASGSLIRYEGFLKLVLPKEDSQLRADTINRGLMSHGIPKIRSAEVGYLLVQLLEAEVALRAELLLRKKKLCEHEWLNQSKNLIKRSFVYLQSQAAVPGVGHLSVLGVSRLLGPDFKNILDQTDVERVFHRILFQANSDSSLLITYNEWERFFFSKEVASHLSELYLCHLTTKCPGCGAFCQREGGACNNITCSMCRTSFVCKTDVVDIISSDDEEEIYHGHNNGNKMSMNSNNSNRNFPLGAVAQMSHGLSLDLRSPRLNQNHNNTIIHSQGNGTNYSNYSINSQPQRPRSANTTRLDYSTLERSAIVQQPQASPRYVPNQGNGQKKVMVFHNQRPKSANNNMSMNQSHNMSSMSPKNRHLNNNTSFMSSASTMAPQSPGARSNLSNRSIFSVLDNNNNNMNSSGSSGDERVSATLAALNSLGDVSSPRNNNTSGINSLNSHNSRMNQSLNLSYMNKSDAHLSHSVLQQARFERQKHALKIVSQTMLEMLDLDQSLEKEKTILWQNGINIESAFQTLDRFNKSYLSDTDLWQSLQLEVNFQATYSQICTMFKDLKTPFFNDFKTNQLSLAEFTKMLFPMESEEWQNVNLGMKDDECKNVLYVVRATVSCPGCGIRSQRTHEGCPSVCCPCCRTSYRCNLIGEDRDQVFRLTLPQKRKLRQFLCKAIQSAVKTELLRKKLLHSAASASSMNNMNMNLSPSKNDSNAHDALNSTLLDSYLMLAGEKSYITFEDVKRCLLSQALDTATNGRRFSGMSLRQIEQAWWRISKGREEVGFVDFAQQMRPFGSL